MNKNYFCVLFIFISSITDIKQFEIRNIIKKNKELVFLNRRGEFASGDSLINDSQLIEYYYVNGQRTNLEGGLYIDKYLWDINGDTFGIYFESNHQPHLRFKIHKILGDTLIMENIDRVGNQKVKVLVK